MWLNDKIKNKFDLEIPFAEKIPNSFFITLNHSYYFFVTQFFVINLVR